MSSMNSIEQDGMDDYEIHGGKIHNAGYQAGFHGQPCSQCPFPSGRWQGEIWSEAWQLGHMKKRSLESPGDPMSIGFN